MLMNLNHHLNHAPSVWGLIMIHLTCAALACAGTAQLHPGGRIQLQVMKPLAVCQRLVQLELHPADSDLWWNGWKRAFGIWDPCGIAVWCGGEEGGQSESVWSSSSHSTSHSAVAAVRVHVNISVWHTSYTSCRFLQIICSSEVPYGKQGIYDASAYSLKGSGQLKVTKNQVIWLAWASCGQWRVSNLRIK